MGWAAVVLTQIFWLPNIWRIVRTREVEGYSVPAWVIMFAGLSCWLVYFANKGDLVGTVANVCGVTGAGITLGLVWYWGRKRRESIAAGVAAALSPPLTTDQG